MAKLVASGPELVREKKTGALQRALNAAAAADDDADDDDADADADDDDDSLFMKRYCLVLSLMHTGCILLKGQLSHSLEIKKKYYKKCFYVNSVSLSLGMMDGYQSV